MDLVKLKDLIMKDELFRAGKFKVIHDGEYQGYEVLSFYPASSEVDVYNTLSYINIIKDWGVVKTSVELAYTSNISLDAMIKINKYLDTVEYYKDNVIRGELSDYVNPLHMNLNNKDYKLELINNLFNERDDLYEDLEEVEDNVEVLETQLKDLYDEQNIIKTKIDLVEKNIKQLQRGCC